MENKKIRWCFKIKDGLKMVEPNERLSTSYLEQAIVVDFNICILFVKVHEYSHGTLCSIINVRDYKSSLLRAKKDFEDKDLLWATVAIYYAEYYALYSFLQRIGVKCENHTCSILTVTILLGENKTKTINLHKDKRIDAQYYMKVDQESKISLMLEEGQEFISYFDELVSNISDEEIKKYRNKVSSC